MLLPLALPLVCAAAPYAAVEGYLVQNGAPLDGVVDIRLEVRDQDEAVLVEHTATGVVVVAGAFAVLDLDVAALATQAALEPLTLEVSATGIGAVRVPYPVPAAALRATEAEVLLHASTASTADGHLPDELAARSVLATAAALNIPFANLVDVPASIADGVDEGPLTANSSTIVVDGVVLRVAPGAIINRHIADGAVSGAALIAGTIDAIRLADNAVTSAKLAAGTLTDADFAPATLATGTIQGTEPRLYAVDDLGCELPVGAITTLADCQRSTAGCSFGYARDCSTNTCISIEGTSASCSNTAIGRLLFAP